MSIPNGLQQHVLISMDGRTWIENVHSAGPSLQRLIDRGDAKMIPQDKLAELVKSVQGFTS